MLTNLSLLKCRSAGFIKVFTCSSWSLSGRLDLTGLTVKHGGHQNHRCLWTFYNCGSLIVRVRPSFEEKKTIEMERD